MACPPKLSKELQTAVFDDHRKQAIDAAKKRAVTQQVDYDTFKNMVLVAHLKPIQTPSTTRQADAMPPAWRLDAEGRKKPDSYSQAAGAAASSMAAVPSGHLLSAAPTQPPSSSAAFQRQWHRNCPTAADKYAYLKLCTAERLRSIFSVEICGQMLGEILGVLDACWPSTTGGCGSNNSNRSGAAPGHAQQGVASSSGASQEAEFVAAILQALRGAGRFNLSVRLLGKQHKQAMSRLLSNLQWQVTEQQGGSGGLGAIVEQLHQLYAT